MIPIKTPAEIEQMRASCHAVYRIREELRDALVPGVTTRDIDQLAAKLIQEAGGRSAFLNYRGFPGHICISVNEEVVHGIGGSRRIQYGDVVKIDVGIILNGWVGDTALSIPVGEIDPDTATLLEATQEALERGIDQARPGNRVRDIGRAVESHVARHGFSVVREFVGHGVGRQLHEEPHVPNYAAPGRSPKLKPGMVLAIEPMVNMGRPEVRILADKWTVVTDDGKPSAHFEHTVLVTEDEPEILTCLETIGSKSSAR
ncbi:MAG: type I methionyl aminopeptidase [Verrucomicrobiota bacterium]